MANMFLLAEYQTELFEGEEFGHLKMLGVYHNREAAKARADELATAAKAAVNQVYQQQLEIAQVKLQTDTNNLAHLKSRQAEAKRALDNTIIGTQQTIQYYQDEIAKPAFRLIDNGQQFDFVPNDLQLAIYAVGRQSTNYTVSNQPTYCVFPVPVLD